MSDIDTAEALALINRATTGIINYMLERGPIAPSSELRHFVKQEMVDLLATVRLAAKRELLNEIARCVAKTGSVEQGLSDIIEKYSPTRTEEPTNVPAPTLPSLPK